VYPLTQLRLVFTSPKRSEDILTGRRKEARIDPTVRAQAHPAAIAAEGLGNRRDDTHFTASVGKRKTLCHIPSVSSLDRTKFGYLSEASSNRRRRNDLLHLPSVACAHIHEFDEANNVARTSKVLNQGHNLFLVDPASNHAVDLDRRKASILSGLDPTKHIFRAEGRRIAGLLK